MSDPEIKNVQNDDNALPVSTAGNSEPSIGVMERRGMDRLFLDYYGLFEQPFGVTPDPRFLYLGAKHRQALDVLNFGTELNRGFLTLIAKPGMGKTSLLFHYLNGLRNKARTVFLFQTDGDATQLMRYLLADLGLGANGMDLPDMRALLSQVLMNESEAGRRFVLVIDEAQNLGEKVLESVRLLSNFETPWMKLMHIVLAGQPQLAEHLAMPSMAQLRQRVSFAVRIEPFNREEVDLYIDHRLGIAGYKGATVFTAGARALLAERSEGIPRNINNICFCAMSYAWAMKLKTVDRQMMIDVLADLDPGATIEKRAPAPAPHLPEEPKPAVSQIPFPSRPSVVSSTTLLKDRPSRSWLPKTLVVGLVFFGLSWFGLQHNIDKSIGATIRAFSGAISNSLAPTPEQVSPNPPPAPNNWWKTGQRRELNNKDARTRRPAGADPSFSPSSGGGHD